MEIRDRAPQSSRNKRAPSPALRRAGQFFRALFARVRAQEIENIAESLTPAQLALFARLQRSDQRHTLDVWNTLRSAGYDDPLLLQAALLHDVGKAATRLLMWHRVAYVLIKRFAPDWLAGLTSAERGWKAPLAAYALHAQRSADWAEEAGSDPRVVACIRSHHQPDVLDEWSTALRWADEQH